MCLAVRFCSINASVLLMLCKGLICLAKIPARAVPWQDNKVSLIDAAICVPYTMLLLARQVLSRSMTANVGFFLYRNKKKNLDS